MELSFSVILFALFSLFAFDFTIKENKKKIRLRIKKSNQII
jgi:hypothetical protein